jgi:hypothetical protein
MVNSYDMKKTSQLIITFLLLLIPTFGQSQKKNDKPNPMKGIKTQTMIFYRYEGEFGYMNENLISKTIYRYDSNGNTVEELHYDDTDIGEMNHDWKMDKRKKKQLISLGKKFLQKNGTKMVQ